MARYTFTCEHFDYDLYRGDEIGVASKHSTEFRADTIETMLENFEMFLRGAGFHFDGVIDVVKPDDERDAEEDLRAIDDFIDDQRGHRVFDSMVNTLMQDDNSITISAGANDWDNQYNINLDTMNVSLESIDLSSLSQDDMIVIDSSQIPTLTTGVSNYSFEMPSEEYCSLCKLPCSVMKLHQCFDPKCPSGAYRNQYAN